MLPGLSAVLGGVVAAVRRRAGRVEAVIRCGLPAWAGGRLSEHDVTGRLLGVADSDRIAALLGLGVAHPLRSRLPHDLEMGDRFCYGLFRGNDLVACGWCREQWAPAGIGGMWFSEDVVRADLRGRGLGQLLHRGRLAEAARRGITEIYAFTSADNAAALGALVAVGFRRVDRPEWVAIIREHRRARGRRDVEQVVLGKSTVESRESTVESSDGR